MAANFDVKFLVNRTAGTYQIQVTDTSSGFTLSKAQVKITYPDNFVENNTDWDNPDISSEDLWSIISGGIIANVDSLNWTPSAVADKLWLKVCNESGSICDRSLSSFKVVSTNTISSGSNLFNNWKIKQKRVANGKR